MLQKKISLFPRGTPRQISPSWRRKGDSQGPEAQFPIYRGTCSKRRARLLCTSLGLLGVLRGGTPVKPPLRLSWKLMKKRWLVNTQSVSRLVSFEITIFPLLVQYPIRLVLNRYYPSERKKKTYMGIIDFKISPFVTCPKSNNGLRNKKYSESKTFHGSLVRSGVWWADTPKWLQPALYSLVHRSPQVPRWLSAMGCTAFLEGHLGSLLLPIGLFKSGLCAFVSSHPFVSLW